MNERVDGHRLGADEVLDDLQNQASHGAKQSKGAGLPRDDLIPFISRRQQRYQQNDIQNGKYR